MYKPTHIPPKVDLESKAILKKLVKAHAALAELKGVASTIPNENILINTLVLQEAKDSSEIENIITTHDELFKADLDLQFIQNIAAKEVQNYATALKTGFAIIKKQPIINHNCILAIHQELEQNNAGYRRVTGTTLKNAQTDEVIYTPPQSYDEIIDLMNNLLEYVNINDDDTDVLVKMAVIHFQFESIHPFYDGNGRTGRILNILYLVITGYLNLPILYLSRYITQHKQGYYKGLQAVRDDNSWEEWILYMLDGIEQISRQTIILINGIKDLMKDQKHIIRDKHSFYSQDLLNNLFKHPYTKIEFLQEDLGMSRQTASKYLNALADDGILQKVAMGRTHYFVNTRLFELFVQVK
jgi:Fic family protein